MNPKTIKVHGKTYHRADMIFLIPSTKKRTRGIAEALNEVADDLYHEGWFTLESPSIDRKYGGGYLRTVFQSPDGSEVVMRTSIKGKVWNTIEGGGKSVTVETIKPKEIAQALRDFASQMGKKQ